MGTPGAFLVAFAVIVVWGVTGPLFGFSDTWQLVINTGTTIVTFLMVFLIQNTQNRDAKALHIKLDELIRAVEAAHNDIIDVEDADDEELNALQERFRKERERARREEGRRGSAA
jgi:low affinity Fe/Cu permease